MRTIHFKNGKRKKITQKEMESINEQIMAGKSGFAVFIYSSLPYETNLIINISEITYID